VGKVPDLRTKGYWQVSEFPARSTVLQDQYTTWAPGCSCSRQPKRPSRFPCQGHLYYRVGCQWRVLAEAADATAATVFVLALLPPVLALRSLPSLSGGTHFFSCRGQKAGRMSSWSSGIMSVFDDFEVCACAAWPSFFCACTHFRVLPTICIPQSPTHQAASAHSSCFRRTFILTWCMALVRVVCRPIALPSSLKEWAATTVVRQPRSKSPRSGGIAPTGFCRYRVPSALRSYHGLSVRVCFLEAGPPAQVPDRGAAAS
jgi:hypothetical protein